MMQRDPLQIETLRVYTRARLIESDCGFTPAPLMGVSQRADGVLVECSFLSLASLASFLREMTPPDWYLFVGELEDADELLCCICELRDNAPTIH